jgi:DNA invertase Pin-like site-specific DNA recombinase
VGVVRVSRVGARSGETFVSPSEQRMRIEQACAQAGLELIEVIEELDVSGGAALAQRPGLSRAIGLIETGEADVVVVAYLDRLVRSLQVQAEVVSRVEKAGGDVLTVDAGALTNGSSAQWLSGTLLGAVSEYARRVTAERTADAKRRAVERGVPPFPNVPPGYQRGDGGRLEPHPIEASTVGEAFRLRAEGSTVMDVRTFLRERGIERSYHGVQAMLGSRIYLGELSFGALVNPASHPAIVDAETWTRVQRARSPRGKRAKSERLLARLGVLRCATCGARMVVGSAHHGQYALYRCPPVGDCPQRVTISAEVAERAVVEATKRAIGERQGSASASGAAEQAEREHERAEADLAAAVEAFSGLDDVAAARERLLALRDERDRKRERADELRAAVAPALTVSVDDWDRLTVDEQRALIRAAVDEVTVAPGRGADRITVRTR